MNVQTPLFAEQFEEIKTSLADGEAFPGQLGDRNRVLLAGAGAAAQA